MSEETGNRDYEHKTSVREHGSVRREKGDPKTGLEPLSLWLFGSCALVLILGGSYLGAKSGGFDFGTTTVGNYRPERPDVPLVEKVLTPTEKWIADGQAVYAGVCNGCHMANGKGQGQIPPLVESEWVTGGTERFAQIILKGLKGPITVAGNAYGGQEMQPQGQLSDADIARVMSYVRHNFGGATDLYVTAEMVAAAREKYSDRNSQYTVGELASADAMLPGDQPEWANPDAAAGDAAGGSAAEGEAGAEPADDGAEPPAADEEDNQPQTS